LPFPRAFYQTLTFYETVSAHFAAVRACFIAVCACFIAVCACFMKLFLHMQPQRNCQLFQQARKHCSQHFRTVNSIPAHSAFYCSLCILFQLLTFYETVFQYFITVSDIFWNRFQAYFMTVSAIFRSYFSIFHNCFFTFYCSFCTFCSIL
jgi:hypothetical protein